MAGGIYFPKGRRTGRVWVSWNGKKIWINQYLDGTPLYSEQQALRVLERVRSEIDQRTFDPDIWGKERSLIFQNAWNQYQEQMPVGLNRMEARERIFNTFLLPVFKDKSLKEIEEHHVNEWWSSVLQRGFKPAYAQQIKATLRAFLSFHRVTRVKGLRFPTVKIPRISPEWLTPVEQEIVSRYIPIQHRGVIRFCMVYGCRPSEACNLRKSDINWQKMIFTLRERKGGKDNTLPILAEIEAILRLGSRKVESLEYAFSTPSGLKYTRHYLYTVWNRASTKANRNHGLKIVSLKNGTRHSKASQLRSQGESLGVIARILGNSERVVEQAYGRVSVEKVGEVLAFKKVEGGIPVGTERKG